MYILNDMEWDVNEMKNVNAVNDVVSEGELYLSWWT